MSKQTKVNDKEAGDNGYIGYYRGGEFAVYAPTPYDAQKRIATFCRARRSSDVTVMIAEGKDGKPVVHSTAGL